MAARKTAGKATVARTARKFGAVDDLFGEPIQVKRSLYFTMAAKTFYVQGEETTTSTTPIGSVRLDLETGEALATLDMQSEVLIEAYEQGEAQLEVFRKAVEKLLNRKRVRKARGDVSRARPQASGENHWRRRKAREAAAAEAQAAHAQPQDLEEVVATNPGDEIDQKFAVRDKVKAKRERDAALKREKRALAKQQEQARAVGGVYMNIPDADLERMLDGTPENDPEQGTTNQGFRFNTANIDQMQALAAEADGDVTNVPEPEYVLPEDV